MKVVCLQANLTESQVASLGFDKDSKIGFELTPNREYTVLGLSFQASSTWNKGVIVLLRDDVGRCAFVPICLLEVSNALTSRFWIAKKKNEQDLCLWPEEFFTDFFHDDLSEGVAAVSNIFKRVCDAIEGENLL